MDRHKCGMNLQRGNTSKNAVSNSKQYYACWQFVLHISAKTTKYVVYGFEILFELGRFKYHRVNIYAVFDCEL